VKNGLMIWNVILSLAVGVLLFLQFGPKKRNANKGDKVVVTDTSANKQFRIAYFEMDSVEANFNMVKDVKAEINTREIQYNSNLNQLDETYRKKYNELASKQYTSKEEEDAAQNILRELGESLKGQKQDIDQKYQEFLMRKNLDIKKKIEDYLKEYNKTRNYSYIISYEQGLFYFRDTAYNITADIIKGLNEFYKPGKSK
jgi:outer membrane protein